MLRKARPVMLATAGVFVLASQAFAQSGSVERAVGGYTFEEAAQEGPETKNFNSDDGVLTFAIVTHTAGNGFFDPVYVGARVAGDLIGAKVLLLGSESPTDDPAREIEILNQIVQDPTLDGLILTTPQVGAYNDIVRTAEQRGIPVATTNSYDGTLYNRNGISHTGQDASAAAIAGEALVACLEERGNRVRLHPAAVLDRDGQHRGQRARDLGVQRHRHQASGGGQAAGLRGRRRPREHRHRHQSERSGERHHLAVRIRAATWSARSPPTTSSRRRWPTRWRRWA